MTATKPAYAFFKGKIVPIEDAKVSVMTHSLHYGTAVFGGLRAYWNDDEEQLFIFRPHDHFERLLQSAGLLRMELPYTPADLTNILSELIRTEGYRENVYIRPLAYKSTPVIGVRLHDLDDDVTMFAQPFGGYMHNETHNHVCISAWRRVDDNAIPARGKIAGAYANSALLKTDAVLSGYDEAIVLNNDGHVSEMSAANIFVIRRGVVITPPVNANVLEGITRRSIIQMLRDDLGVEVVEREIDRTEIYLADELFMCGTGVQVASITKVEHRPIGNEEPGPITEQVKTLFHQVVRGHVSKYREWLTPVYTTETVAAK